VRINENGIQIDEYSKNLERRCSKSSCQKKYRILDYMEGSESMFYPPVKYAGGCSKFCLECWLDVSEYTDLDSSEEQKEHSKLNLRYPTEHDHWYNENNFKEIDNGNLQLTYKDYLNDGCHLAILPLSRIHVEKAIYLPCGLMIYPEGRIDFSDFDLNSGKQCELSSLQSTASGVSLSDFNRQPVLIIPLKLNWNSLLFTSHFEHMEIIRTLSEMFDSMFFNFLKYQNCQLTYIPDEGLPNSLGQINSNQMMAAALFLKNGSNKGKIIAGAAYSHRITRGTGIVLNQPEWDDFPHFGEVGAIVRHALFLYSQLIHTESSTSRYIQAISLLEFLADPQEFQKMQDVKKIISRYVSSNEQEREKIHERFKYLTGKKDANKNEIGLRTRMVHIGARLEDLIPFDIDRTELFKELDMYIRSVVDHMIKYSSLSISEYKDIRQSM
jgi:hypothetical protein